MQPRVCWCALGSPQPAANLSIRQRSGAGMPQRRPHGLSQCGWTGAQDLTKGNLRAFSRKKKIIGWKMLLLVLQSSEQHGLRRKENRDFLSRLPIFIPPPPQKKKVNEMCDFLCIICTTARIPLLIKSICLTILSRSLRNQYLLAKEPQSL